MVLFHIILFACPGLQALHALRQEFQAFLFCVQTENSYSVYLPKNTSFSFGHIEGIISELLPKEFIPLHILSVPDTPMVEPDEDPAEIAFAVRMQTHEFLLLIGG